jgi:hypothetical protein
LYISRLARATDPIPHIVNRVFVTLHNDFGADLDGPPAPFPLAVLKDFWAQG